MNVIASGGQRCSEENCGVSCVKRDMKAMGIKEEMAQSTVVLGRISITGGPTRA